MDGLKRKASSMWGTARGNMLNRARGRPSFSKKLQDGLNESLEIKLSETEAVELKEVIKRTVGKAIERTTGNVSNENPDFGLDDEENLDEESDDKIDDGLDARSRPIWRHMFLPKHQTWVKLFSNWSVVKRMESQEAVSSEEESQLQTAQRLMVEAYWDLEAVFSGSVKADSEKPHFPWLDEIAKELATDTNRRLWKRLLFRKVKEYLRSASV